MKDKLDYIRYHIDYLNNKYWFDFMLIWRPYKLVQKMWVWWSRKDLYIKWWLDWIVAYIDCIYKAIDKLNK